MTIKSILLSAWLTTCLVMTPSRHFQENAFCEAHASIQEVSVKGAINNHIDQQPDTFLNNYATVYFSNLNENFPINSHGTCVFTALSSVLTFFDCYVDDDYVDNGFLKSSIVDNSSSGPDKAIPYNTPSPGSTPEPLDLVISLSETEYGDFIYQNRNSYLQSHLIQLAKSMYPDLVSESDEHIRSLTPYEETHLAMYYLIYERSITNNRANITCSPEGTSEEIKNYIVDLVSDGIPVIVNASSSIVGDHAFIAYDYDKSNKEIYAHCGWNDGSGNSLTHVSLKEMGVETSSLTSAFAIVPTSGNPSSCVGKYVNANHQQLETRDFAYPSNLRCDGELFVDDSPIIKWDSLYEEKWFYGYDPYIQVTIRDHFGYVLSQDNVHAGCSFKIDEDLWRKINIELPYEDFSVSVELKSDHYSFFENHLSASFLRPDKSSKRQVFHIKPQDFDGYYDGYAVDEETKTVFMTHHTQDGFAFRTRRYRAGFIQNEKITLSPMRRGFQEAFVEFQFFVPVDRIDIDLSYWRDAKTEGLTRETGRAVIEEYRYGAYNTANPLLDLLSSEANLPEDRQNMKTYKLKFPRPITRFRLYTSTFLANTNDNNRGRICIGDIFIFENNKYNVKDRAIIATSGGELAYNPSIWNDDSDTLSHSKCYCYAINYRVTSNSYKIDPGASAEPQNLSLLMSDESRKGYYYDKDFLYTAVRADSMPGVIHPYGFVFNELKSKYDQLGENTYKVALVLQNEQPHKNKEGYIEPDYHWYRQNPDGTWSHKPGQTKVRDYDFDGNEILDPEYCNRKSALTDEDQIAGRFNYNYTSKVYYFSVKINTEEYEYEEGYYNPDWFLLLGHTGM